MMGTVSAQKACEGSETEEQCPRLHEGLVIYLPSRLMISYLKIKQENRWVSTPGVAGGLMAEWFVQLDVGDDLMSL